jgi:hypothetical protein
MSNPSGRRRAARSSRSTSVSMRATSGPPTSIINQSKAGGLSISGSDRSIRVRGTEFIRVLTMPASPVPGTVLLRLPNVAGPMNTRLANFAAIFERWRPFKYSYRYVPSVSTTTAGSIILANEPDVAAQYPDPETSNIPRLTSLSGHRTTALWQPAVCGLASMSDYTSLWTTDVTSSTTDLEEDRFDAAGQFLCVLLTPPGSAFEEGASIGSLELEYDIEFFRPRLALSQGAGEEAETISKVPPGTFPQFGSSNSYLALSRLLQSVGLSKFTYSNILKVVEKNSKVPDYNGPTAPMSSSSSCGSLSSGKSESLPITSSSSTSLSKPSRIGAFTGTFDNYGVRPGVYEVEVWSGFLSPASDSGVDQLLICPYISQLPSSESVKILSGTLAQDASAGPTAPNQTSMSHEGKVPPTPDTSITLPSGETCRVVQMRKFCFEVLPNREFALYDLPLIWGSTYEELEELGVVTNIVLRTRCARRILDFTSSTSGVPSFIERKDYRSVVRRESKEMKPIRTSAGPRCRLCPKCETELSYDSETNSSSCHLCEAVLSSRRKAISTAALTKTTSLKS